MTAGPTAGLTLDTGALLALDRESKAVAMQARLEATHRRGCTICIPAEVVARAWRGHRQVRPARLLKSPDVEIATMTLSMARAVGLVCAESGHSDVVDVHAVLGARERRHAIVTSDPDGVARVDPALPLIRV